jgi:hypothetical protein
MPHLGLSATALAIGFGITDAAGAIPDTVHPDFSVSEIPMPGQYKTMGLAFLKDGRMALAVTDFVGWGEMPAAASNKHKILLVDGPGTSSPKVTEIAHTWFQLSGLTVAGDKLYAADRDGFYEIQDLNPDPGADLSKNRRLVVKWPDEGAWNVGGFQYHQWAFTPLYRQGSFYAPYAGVTRQGGHSDVNPTSRMAGALLKWGSEGRLEAVAGGLRVPNGAGVDETTGEIFVTDNQGGWLPGSTFMRIRPGRFYGHSNKSPTTPANWAETLPYDPPVAWLPYKNVRVSPSQPVQVRQGLYAGDWLLGDVASPGLLRISLDKVGDGCNGAVFWFTHGFRNAAINRMAWGSDGALYIGTFLTIAANWPGGRFQPMFRLSPKGTAAAFEMKAVRSARDGLEIEFTQPVDAATALKANFTARQWQYIRQLEYGTGKQPDQPLSVSETAVSADGRRVYLKMAGLVRDRVVHLKHSGMKSASGAAPWNDEAWFTHNEVSTREWSPAPSSLMPPPPAVSRYAKGISSRVTGRGNLAVSLGAPGPWTAALVAPDGAVAARRWGAGPARFELSAGAARTGLFLLRVRLEDGEVVRKVVF